MSTNESNVEFNYTLNKNNEANVFVSNDKADDISVPEDFHTYDIVDLSDRTDILKTAKNNILKSPSGIFIAEPEFHKRAPFENFNNMIIDQLEYAYSTMRHAEDRKTLKEQDYVDFISLSQKHQYARDEVVRLSAELVKLQVSSTLAELVEARSAQNGSPSSQ